MKTTEEQSKESLNTPLPWLPYYLAMGGTMMGDNDHRYIVGPDGVLVADLYADTAEDFGLPEHEQVESNCELICRAVNNHEKLIEALQNLVDGYSEYADESGAGIVENSLIEAARLVLANAGVQP